MIDPTKPDDCNYARRQMRPKTPPKWAELLFFLCFIAFVLWYYFHRLLE